MKDTVLPYLVSESIDYERLLLGSISMRTEHLTLARSIRCTWVLSH